MSTTTPDPAPELYTVNRLQDGAEVRRELDFESATSECAILNAQARMPVGQTRDGVAIFGSMFHGQICRYEVRSQTSDLVIA